MPRVKLRTPPSHLKIPKTPTVRISGGLRPTDERLDAAAELAEHMPWEQFYRFFHSTWKQGEHVTFLASTGGGKTTTALGILPIRKYDVAFVTKAKDEVLFPGLRKQGFKEVREWVPNAEHEPKVLLRPAPQDTSLKEEKREREAFRYALDYMFQAGGWCCYFDELKYITDDLNLSREVNKLYLQGRSLGVSLVANSQRPAWIPQVALNQATHLFIGSLTDRRDLDRAAEVAAGKAMTVRSVVPDLDMFEFLYVQTRNRNIPSYVIKSEKR